MRYLIAFALSLFASAALAATVTITSVEAPAATNYGWQFRLHVTVANASAPASLTAAYGAKQTTCAFGATDAKAGLAGNGEWTLLCGIVKAPANPGPYSSGANSGDTVPVWATWGGQMFRAGSGTKSTPVDVKLP